MPLLLAMLLGGCTDSVMPAYDDARNEAMRQGGPAPASWKPDAVITLSHNLLGTLLTEVLGRYGTLEDEWSIGVATLHPSLQVTSVRLGRAECERCLGVGATLEGMLDVKSAIQVGSTQAPMTVDAAFDVVVDVVQANDKWTVQLTPKQMQDVDVTVAGVGVPGVKQAMRDWFNREMLSDVPPQEITTLGGNELPVRAVSVVPVSKALQLQILTAVADPEPVTLARDTPKNWRLDVSPSTLVKIASTQAYAAGPLEHDIMPVPTNLVMQGERFKLGLRLWRVSGRGWWRDYVVSGSVAVKKRKFVFNAAEAKKVGQSKGAALADPLAALGQGVILQAIEGALQTTLPATHQERGDGLRTVVAVRSIDGTKTRVTAEGRLVVQDAPGRTRAKIQRDTR